MFILLMVSIAIFGMIGLAFAYPVEFNRVCENIFTPIFELIETFFND